MSKKDFSKGVDSVIKDTRKKKRGGNNSEPSKMERRKRVTTMINKDYMAQVKALGMCTGKSNSDIINDALKKHLAKETERQDKFEACLEILEQQE